MARCTRPKRRGVIAWFVLEAGCSSSLIFGQAVKKESYLYPRTYFETFMRYEASDQVFVAMPFSPPFQNAYDSVIEPAILRVAFSGHPLVPRIINRGTFGAPDIHEQIFDAILHSRLLIADLSVQSSHVGDDGRIRWQANANVAYEVGLAAAWRNPEDILLIHQGHSDHSYSFDVQNLRHVQYDPANPDSVDLLIEEIVRALNRSSFLANHTYQKIIDSVSPSTIQFMHQEVMRAFPVISFMDKGMPIFDARIHAASELLSFRALKNRHVVPQGAGKGVAVVYEWTELGLRMLNSLHAANSDRLHELRKQIASVPMGQMPPSALRDLPSATTEGTAPINMVEATKVETGNEASKVE